MPTKEEVLSIGESRVPPNQHVRTRRVFVAKKTKKDESLLGVLCAWLVEHQIGFSLNLLTLLLMAHISFPRARRRTRKFFEMSYYNPETQEYGRGWDDMYFVFFWIVLVTGLRAAVMDYVLMPFGKWGGVKTKKGVVRFAEQGWLVVYCSIFWSLGMYIMYNSPYWFNLKEMWSQFPTQNLSKNVKWYYLVQFAFWLQQLFVVNIEERRKDHWQMFTHHIFTSALLFTSYGFYQTRVGNVILCIMDVVDILLSGAKMLNYVGLRTLCDIAFGVFLIVWFLTRHVAYLTVCWSVYAHVPSVMPYGCYDSTTGQRISSDGGSSILTNILQPFNDPAGTVCFNKKIRYAFLGLLMALQVLTMIWFGMIIRVAYGVIIGKAAQDERSEDEAEEEEIEEEYEVDDWDVKLPSLQSVQTLDPEALNKENITGMPERASSPSSVAKGRGRRAGAARASAISLPDRKELLGRIGCDKPTS